MKVASKKMAQWKTLLWTILLISLLVREGESRSLKFDSILGKQKDIIRLLKQLDSKDCFKTTINRAQGLDIGLGSKEIFTVFNGDHLEDAKKLYTSLVTASSYEDFYDRAVWARKNVNAGLFAYAFSAAVLHGTHTRDVILPPLHEINPYYFISGNVMKEANEAKENHSVIEVDVSNDDIRYFTEDVGINSYYYFINLLMPFWNYDDEYPVRYRNGEYYLHLHQQLLARYNLERYALGLNTTPSFDYEHPIKLGYHSDLSYPNGVSFPSRKDDSEIAFRDVLDFEMTNDTNVNAYTYLKDFEEKLRDFINTDNSNFREFTTIMGINSHTDHSGKFNYARIILGNPTKTSRVPSALEHYETSLRDPMFWPMTKRMLYFYNKFGNYYPYNHQPVINNDIIVSKVTVDNLETYFENYTISLANGIKTENCEYLDVQANTKRLNHKPFSYTITLTSTNPIIFVKVFIGPKYDGEGKPLTLRQNRFNFVEIDRFLYRPNGFRSLGIPRSPEISDELFYNDIIKRYSFQNKFFSDDRTTFHEFYDEIIDGFVQGDAYEVSNLLKYHGFPRRFMLPKGSAKGTKFQLYVIAIPTNEDGGEEQFTVDNEFDFNYPFNRPISDDAQLLGPNAFLRDITIYHKD